MARFDVIPAARFDVAAFGALLSEPSRVAILLALMDGSARPATELARYANVSPQTASSHFGKLVQGGLLAVELQGRHRYYRIANDRVAHALESAALVRTSERAVLRRDPGETALRFARTCYRHLAGKLGVDLATHLVSARILLRRSDRYEVTAEGARRFESLDIDPARGLFGTPYLDWTERRHHIAGPLGVALASRLFAEKWLARMKEGRAVRLTATGERGFRTVFGFEPR
jgi:DNA-binding transcriptional ArsR family regulator